MSENSDRQDARYRLVGIRQDGSRATVLGSMTYDEAKRAREVLSAACIFASVDIAVDSGDDILIPN